MLIPLKDENAVIQGYLEIGRDISEEIRFEQRLRQKQKLEAIGTLAGGVAHDFNNVLGGIFGYAEVALLQKDSPADTEKNLGQIIKAAERARDLISQILTFSRETKVNLRPLSPKVIVKEVLKLLRPSLKASINIESRIASDSTIMAEPTQIHQIVMNLFTNAAHAIDENPGTITLGAGWGFGGGRELRRLAPQHPAGQALGAQGPPTPAAASIPKLWSIYSSRFTPPSPKGMRAPAWACRWMHGIVEKLGRHNHTVYVRGGPGRHSSTSSCRSSRAAEAEPQPEPAAAQAGGGRILVVDDEVAIAKPMRYLLGQHGFTVSVFMDGFEALEALKTDPGGFDLVVTDHIMPGITGLDLAKKMKEAGVDKPVILTSGYFEPRTEEAARAAGISEFITKPIDINKLAGLINRLLGNEPA